MKPRPLFLSILALSASPAFALEPWVDALPIPPRIMVTPGNHEITLHMNEFTGKIHRDLPTTKQWGFEGTSPGPTIEVERDQPLTVHWVNDLPATHMLKAPVDEMVPQGAPDVRTVIHLHGAVVEQPSITDKLHDNDGWPDLWLAHGEQQIAQYNNPQNARTLWYHDHSMGSTGRNVAAGLLGTYVIHDDLERSLNLPSGKYDIPLVIQPKKLKADGSIDYVTTLTRENYGNAFFVNGKMYPYLDVEPRKYRFRLINASNARTVALKLLDASDLTSGGPAFHQIGSDSGFLADTVKLNDPAVANDPRLVLMPAERADIIIDFSQYAGKNFILHNNQKPDDSDSVVPLYQIMMFKVASTTSDADTSKIPAHIRDIARIDPATAVRSRQIALQDMVMGGVDMLTLNGKMWNDPVDDFATLGTTEIWELVNTQPDNHPFHVHLVDFQVLDRRNYDVNAFNKTGKVNYTATADLPLANEMGWKDTVRVTPGQVTRIIMKFGPTTGHYVYHCHILEHENMDMMRPYDVVAPAAPSR
ncbi:MAG: multicopper oxidase family protein [Bdellovibrionota bacterium]